MKRFNLSEWAITHQALVLFMILLIGAAGFYSYTKLGRAEDPSFTIKVMNIHVGWPGATASELQAQVVDKVEKKLQELPFLDRVTSYAQAGEAFIQVTLSDTTPPRRVKELWYQVRKKVGDIRGDLPANITGPNFNDEFGDVYSALYMISADGKTYAELKRLAEDIRQRLLRVRDVNKVDLIGVQPERIFIEFSHARLATLGITPQQIFDSVARQNAVVSGGSVDTSSDRIHLRVTGAFSGADAIAAVPVQADGRIFRLGDIATVRRGYEDPPSFILREGGRPALGLGVSMQDGANILTLGENLKQAMKAITAELPVGIDITQVADQPHIVDGSVSEFLTVFLEALAHRAAGELPHARPAHRRRGGALGAAGARDRLHRHVRDRPRPAPHHARCAHHRARAPGRRRHHRDRDDGGEDGAGFRPRPGGHLRLDLDRVPDADRHAGDGGGISSGRLRQFEHRRVRRRHLLGGRPRVDRLLVRGGAVHALSRHEAVAGFRQTRRRAARAPQSRSDLRYPHLPRAAARDRVLPALAQDRRRRHRAVMFAAIDCLLWSRAAAVLPDLDPHRAVRRDATAGRQRDRRHRRGGAERPSAC